MDKPPIMCYWQENTFLVLLQENIKYSINWLFQRISKKLKFESVLEYRGLIFFGAKELWQHLLCGWIRGRARWRKFCVLIGYPSTSCLLGISRVGPARKFFFFCHIINLLLTNRLVRSRLLDISHFLSYVFIDLDFVLEEKWKIYNTTFSSWSIQKQKDQSSNFDRTSLVNNAYMPYRFALWKSLY